MLFIGGLFQLHFACFCSTPGVPGYSGEHVRATAALIRNSYGVWVSTVGEIFVGDTFNSIARRVNASGETAEQHVFPRRTV